MKRTIRKILGILILISADIFAIASAFVIAMWLREILGNFVSLPILQTTNPLAYQLSNWWILPLYLLIFYIEGLYTKHRPFWQDTRVLWRAILLTALFIYAFISLGKIEDYVSRMLFVMHPLLLLGILPLMRRVLKSLLYRLKYWQTPIVEISVGTDFSMDMSFARNTFIGYHVEVNKKISLGSINKSSVHTEIKSLLKKYNSDTLLIVIKELTSPEISSFLEGIYFLAPHVLIIPENMNLDVMNADIHHMMYDNTYIFDIKKGLNSPIGSFTKRAIDIILSLTGIIVFSPILLILAILVFAKGGGFPIFYDHPRFGKNGKVFTFLKFRSMLKEAYENENDDRLEEYLKKHPEQRDGWNKYQKLDNDPRVIIPIIRKTSLDELAQLFNVLKGDMSIVGPRPYMLREKELMGNYFTRILAAKPGITDLWTVSGRDSLSFEKRLKMSTWYAQNWTPWLDFIIIMKTVQQVILYAFKWSRKSQKQ